MWGDTCKNEIPNPLLYYPHIEIHWKGVKHTLAVLKNVKAQSSPHIERIRMRIDMSKNGACFMPWFLSLGISSKCWGTPTCWDCTQTNRHFGRWTIQPSTLRRCGEQTNYIAHLNLTWYDSKVQLKKASNVPHGFSQLILILITSTAPSQRIPGRSATCSSHALFWSFQLLDGAHLTSERQLPTGRSELETAMNSSLSMVHLSFILIT